MNYVSQILREIEFANFRVMKNVEWLYFCVLNFSRNAKGFDPFFAKFRENCERNKIIQFILLLPLKRASITRILLGLIDIRISHKYMHLFIKLD